MMGLTGCIRRPVEKILPYSKMPENMVPGIPNFYATTLSYAGEGVGVIVESHEGRPTKIEGNTDHPASLGGTTTGMQAAVLDLYDPDRAASATKDGTPAPIDDVLAALDAALKGEEASKGQKLRILTGTSSSPSVERMREAVLARFPQAKFHEFESVSLHNPVAGAKIAFGKPARVHVAYDRARVVVAADSDFLGDEPGSVVASRQWARTRRVLRPTDTMGRMYAVEPAFTVTGMAADHRMPLAASAVEDFLSMLAAELTKIGVPTGGLAQNSRNNPAVDAKFVSAVAKELKANRGTSAIVVGPRQAPSVHALAYALNEALGNIGRTMRFSTVNESSNHASELATLAADLQKGVVSTLVILGKNPVYTAPGDVDFAAVMTKAQNRFYLAPSADETAAQCTYTIHQSHQLEEWGDLRSGDGTFSLVQPLIAPMHGGKSEIEVLAHIADAKDKRAYEIVRHTFDIQQGAKRTLTNTAPPADSAAASATAATSASSSASAMASAAPSVSAAVSAVAAALSAGAAASVSAVASAAAPADSAVAHEHAAAPAGSASAEALGTHDPFIDRAWRRALHDGVVLGTSAPILDGKVDAAAVVAAITASKRAPAPSASALEVVFSPDPGLYDGASANNAWLLEVPHPVTKTCWDNTAWLSANTAAALGVASGDVVKITTPGGKPVEIAAWVVPGTVDFSIAVHLGWGHKKGGRVGTGAGFNVSPLRTTAAFHIASGATVQKTGNTYSVAVTQEHNSLEGRPIVREATLDELRKDPKFVEKMVEHPKLLPLWDEWKYEGHKWGMVVDLNACTGCNACVVACQAENNIPSVGKEQVTRQREMHWLRIDRYFSGKPENPEVVVQPVACVQCENAPCENVCPVNATAHSPEGINEMTYNRCIGTRYCSNNCPYKVRRFNFLDFREDVPETVKMLHNPNVSVRMRGVMEKCNYCVQRVQAAKISAKRDGRKLKDGDVQVACAQACPTEGIIFGDLNDRGSRVSRLAKIDHNYAMLEELATKPRTTYLAKIRNPNPELA
jgi:Fe-S-cluster-containing dehydrogenase component